MMTLTDDEIAAWTPAHLDAEWWSSTYVCRATGVTYRMLDYWCREGIIRPQGEGAGSGRARRFSRTDIAEVRVVAALTELGLTPSRAGQAINLWRRDGHPAGYVGIVGDRAGAWGEDVLLGALRSGRPVAVIPTREET